MQVTGIGWVGILVEDFEAALEFFSDILGLSLAYQDESKELAHFRFRSGQLLEVYGTSNRGRKEKYRFFSGPGLGFEVDNVQQARQEMIARGTRFITQLESWGDDMWSLFLGPEEKLFEILRPTRRSALRSENVLGICSARTSVHDFRKATQFFSQVMEIPLVEGNREHQVARYWLPAGHLFEVVGSKLKESDQLSPIVIGFEVNDMTQARQSMESRGLEFTEPARVVEDGSIRSQFCTPDGYIYELVSNFKHESS